MGLGKKDLDFIKLTSLPSRLEANKAYLIKTGTSSFTIYLTDSKCNALVLDAASYELFFNSIDNSLSLIISSTGQVISKVFLTDLLDSSIASVNINPLDDTIIEFKNSDGVVLSSLTLTIDNIQSLQSELDNKVSYSPQTKTEPEKQQARDNLDIYSDAEIDDFFSGITPITGYNKVNWDTAFGWGDHSGLYEPLFSKGDLVQGTGLTLSGTLTNRLVGAGNITVAHASHTGDVTGSSSLTIANDVVSNLKLSNVAQNTIKGRISTGTGDPEDLNPTQVRAILNIEDGANNYIHPAYSTFSLDTSGAQVIDLLSTDAIGSVTNITTRNLTPSDIGAADSIHTHTVSDITDFPSLVTELSDLSDVNTSTPTNRNVLVADGVDFESRALETDDIQSGTFADARISQSSITQHEAALTITESQISDLQNYSLVGHTHTTTDITDLSSYTGFDSRYYTETEVDNLLHDPVTVTDSSEIDFTLTGQDITASIVAGSIDETKLDASVNSSLDLADSSLQIGDITGAASTILTSDLTNNRALISNGSGKVAVSAVTSTELSYVSGVTSALQTQLDAKLNSSTYTSDWSGLNSGNFLRSDISATKTLGSLNFNNSVSLSFGSSGSNNMELVTGSDNFLRLRNLDAFRIQDATSNRFIFWRATGNFEATGAGEFGGTVSGDDPVNADDFVTKGYAESSFLRSGANTTKTAGRLQYNDNIPEVFGTDQDVDIRYIDGVGFRWNLVTPNFLIQDNGATRFTFERTTGNFTATGTIAGNYFNITKSSTGSDTVAEFGNTTIASGLQVVTNGNLDWGFNALNSRNLVFRTNQIERLRISSSGAITATGTVTAARLNLTSLPTSAAGLTTGDVWNDSGTLKIV